MDPEINPVLNAAFVRTLRQLEHMDPEEMVSKAQQYLDEFGLTERTAVNTK